MSGEAARGPRSRVFVRLALFAQIGELARRLSGKLHFQHQGNYQLYCSFLVYFELSLLTNLLMLKTRLQFFLFVISCYQQIYTNALHKILYPHS